MTIKIPSRPSWAYALAFLLLAAVGCPKPEPQPPMLPGILEACGPAQLGEVEVLDEGRRRKD